MKKTVALHNLGCKVNAYELEAIQQLLEDRGYEIVPFAPGADVYIINTCTGRTLRTGNRGRCCTKRKR